MIKDVKEPNRELHNKEAINLIINLSQHIVYLPKMSKVDRLIIKNIESMRPTKNAINVKLKLTIYMQLSNQCCKPHKSFVLHQSQKYCAALPYIINIQMKMILYVMNLIINNLIQS